MQYNFKDFNPDKHDHFKALTVKQPFANDLVNPAYKDIDGVIFGVKSIEVRSHRTGYRGDLLICSSVSPVFPGMMSGTALGFVELYDIKPIAEFTPEDWDKTRIPRDKRAEITKGYGWLMRNPRRVIEMPVRGQLGIFNIAFTKDTIMEYPRQVIIDKKGWEQIQEAQRKGKK